MTAPPSQQGQAGTQRRDGLTEIAKLFLKLGFVAFGGPAAHIAMMDDEVVTRRKWIDRQHFLDLIGATNLIPGPNSTEMTMHIGYERAGWRGLVTAGLSFVLPAVLITGLIAWFYVSYGSLPEVARFLTGVKPAVIAIILGAVWKLGRTAVKGWRLATIGVAVAFAVLFGADEVASLLAGGLVGMSWLRASIRKQSSSAEAMIPILFLASSKGASGLAGSVSLWKLFFFFMKIGAVLYGSGYVLFAFLEGGLVRDLGWLTESQLIDAIAVGQFTPGPVLSTSTFVGYLVDGIPGAAVATIGIFLPSFLFVLILNPFIPRLRESRWASAFLDAVNVSAVALMAAVTVELGSSVLTSWEPWAIAVVAVTLLVRFKVSPVSIVLGAGLTGWVLSALTG